MPVSFKKVLDLALKLPGVEEGTSYGVPSVKANGKFFLRLMEDGETLVLRVPIPDKEFLLSADPEVFFSTPHYDGHPAILIRLSKVRTGDLQELLERAWRAMVLKKLIAARERARAGSPKTRRRRTKT